MRTMRTIKRMMVHHRNFCYGVTEKLEQWLCQKYHATNVYITDGKAYIEYAGAAGDYKEVDVFIALFRSVFTGKAALPKG